ncbi:arylsulfatase [Candidatus Sumerlaeota bacterium]|nr:arylsulfatase [Candidatus Sumerlaeota bacterium]
MTQRKPNIIIMYADDLGFGDLGCYGASSIPTPNLDNLASQGVRFTTGYASAATCTPSRYSLLTGVYPWKNQDAHILAGDSPLIIPPGSPTLPSMLKQAGYATGVVGKWHLGLGTGDIDWNQEISPGPCDIGFDYSFIMPATNDRVPCVFIDGKRVSGLDPSDPIEVTYKRDNPFPGIPTGKNNPELLRMHYSHGHDMSIVNGVSRIGFMRGGAKALWKDEEMAETFLNRAISFITDNKDQPFFFYYAFHQPHVPRLPSPRFAGKTKLGPRGDVIVEMDWCVGEILKTLNRLGLDNDTIVIFSSDNGPVLDDGYRDQAVELSGDHRPAGPLRGGKYSMYDGGTRVPFLLRWTGVVKPGETSALVSHIDFFASFASLLGVPLAPEACPDSVNVLPALLGQSGDGRTELATEGSQGKIILHRGDWVFIPPYPGPSFLKRVHIETGNSSEPQLYHLQGDIGQIRNLALEQPDLVKEMSSRLQEILGSESARP